MDIPTPSEATSTTPASTPTDTPAAPQTEEKDWKAEAEKWQHFSRLHEGNWKKVSAEADSLRKAQMTDSEKAIAEAEGRGRKAALESIATERAQLKLETAAAKAGVDITPVLEVLDVSKFINEGEVNNDAIGDFVTQFSAQFAKPKEPKFPQGLGIGPQSSQTKPGQLTRADLGRMSAAEIVEADAKGLFDDIKNGLA
ncbi:hypothetical protein [Streptosporangium sp. NPDC002524]|uniref:hypothetical protein n=1 Tax=Streptosporangium sp. NPDC002524 TaxID=3154537 RepID=UPI0033241F7C